jgi:hypothetical protein
MALKFLYKQRSFHDDNRVNYRWDACEQCDMACIIQNVNSRETPKDDLSQEGE